MKISKNPNTKINDAYVFKKSCEFCQNEFFSTYSISKFCCEEHRDLYKRIQQGKLTLIDTTKLNQILTETNEKQLMPVIEIAQNPNSIDNSLTDTKKAENMSISDNLEIETLKYELLKSKEATNKEFIKFTTYNNSYELLYKIAQMLYTTSLNAGRITATQLTALFSGNYIERDIVVHNYKFKRVFMNSEYYQIVV